MPAFTVEDLVSQRRVTGFQGPELWVVARVVEDVVGNLQ